MLNQKLLGKTGEDKQFIEDLFAVHLYTGNGSTQTINNGIDLAGKGGLVWSKVRSIGGTSHCLNDSERNAFKNRLVSNSTSAQETNFSATEGVTSALSNGFVFRSYWNSETYASWTFRKAPKFFDVVTYTGNGASNRQISHNLGVAPGMIITRRYDVGSGWPTYHRSTGASKYLQLNETDPANTLSSYWNNTEPTSTDFTVGTFANDSGGSYIAYLFAHDTTTDGLIQCGSFTTDASGNATVNLGWEPQYVLVKRTDTTSNWYVYDNMRGASNTSAAVLYANLSNAEASVTTSSLVPTATGFTCGNSPFVASATYIYMAIRRGPMKTPTDATKVFALGTARVTSGFPIDMYGQAYRTPPQTWSPQFGANRLSQTGLQSSSTAAEYSATLYWDNNSGIIDNGQGNTARIYWTFQRAPGFFDVVCYTGTGSARTVNHNLGVAPELMIVKRRDSTGNWEVYSSSTGADYATQLNLTNAVSISSVWSSGTPPTSTGFSVSGGASVNASGATYVAYLFASCPGVSKVGSFTGNGTSQTINCGFTNGARFFLVKATSTTGKWWVYDSARGIVSSTDPVLALNSTAAEVTSADAVDPDSTGIIVNQEATCSINANGVSYIYLAIA